ncbi:unnamed protein product [Linum tenue]|uniref:Uncharacterized protein n=1 Tax=Linum tenue TaxID=586396 RepID=A0AAV0IRE8_9ROSI|nr:unnamed protein product [Linum tenue]
MPLSTSAETDQSAGEKKRRRTVRLLPLHEKVEIRSEEEGFLGSWHPGTVIACFKERWQLKYKFKYDHMLRHDKSDFLVGHVDVSLFVDDNIDRGYIRPLPPPLEFGKWILSYGLCVDVSFNEAWWEGVIFDHQDGSDERKVFFPDLGDEVVAHLDTMRITQEWNQVTEQWKQRGTWLFLELIEEYEQVRCLPVSVKQLWYDLQEKEGFKKLGGWTSCSRSIWEELLVDTINDNLKIVLNHLFQEASLPQGMKNLTKLAKSLSCNAVCAKVDSAGAVNPNDRRNRVGKKIMSSPQNDESITSISQSSTSCHVKALPLMLPDTLGSTFVPNATPISSILTRNGETSRSSSQKISSTWCPAGSDIVPRIKFCPSAITEYANGNKRVVGDVRAHLVYMNWKIEFMRDKGILSMRDKGILRVRYTSPSGQCYSSLRQVCLEFSNSGSKDPSFNSVQEHRDSEDGGGGNLSPLLEQPIKDHDSQISTEAVAQSYVYIKPECCPEAIVNWYIFSGYDQARRKAAGKGKYHVMAKRARKHLAVEGWKFMYTVHSGRRELKHISPAGRSYYSLRRACKIYMQESGIDIPSGSIELDGMDIGGTRRGQEERTDGTNIPFHPHQTEDELDSHSFQLQLQSSGSSRTSEGSFKLKTNAIVTQPICRQSSKGAQQMVARASNMNRQTVLSWLVDNKVLLPRAKVYYRSARGECSIAEGRITRDGIKCNCCMKVYSLSRFHDHVGGKCISNYCGADSNIFLQDGRTLLDCQVQIMRDAKLRNSAVRQPKILQERQEVEKNDHVCSVCRYGGDLIMCDLCPSSFHPSCINMTVVPDGDWFCPSCCCRICNNQGLENNSESIIDEHMLNCTQCEHKYHISCLRNKGIDELEHHPNRGWFCSRNCEEIFSSLSALLGKPIPVGVENLSWTLLKFVESDSTGFGASTIEIQAQSYSKLNVALHVMHECFEPLEEPHTRDIVEDVIFSKRSELRRLDFHGFYTVILEKDDEVITVATLRVFGEKAAEVPLIATRPQYRRLGMCHVLLNVLEKKLVELGVQRLVLPAVAGMLNIWTGSFGFTKMADSERLLFLDCTFVEFQETIMCHKQLMSAPSALGSMQEITPVASNPIFQISDDDDHDLVASTPISEVVEDPMEEEVTREHEANDNVAGKITTTRSGYVRARDDKSVNLAKHSARGSSTEGSNGATTLSTGTHEGGELIRNYKRRKALVFGN